MMLDMKRTFDDIVAAHSTPERAEQILENPFYQSLSSSFAGTQEYMAMEKLGQLRATDQWDLIIVDTPPSRSALDFLDAPNKMSRFLDGTMIRLLTGGGAGAGRLKFASAGFMFFSRIISKILGGQLLRDISAFVAALDTMFGGFRERATATYELLRRPGTWFVVVASPEPDALREASYFVDRLSAEGMPLAGLVLNRTHPPATTALSATRAEGAAEEVAESGADGADVAAAALRVHAERMVVAAREQHLADRFTSAHPEVAVRTVPAAAGDVHDLDGLRVMAAELTGAGRGHADRHAAHPGAPRAPRLTWAVGASGHVSSAPMSENVQSRGLLLAKLAATVVVAGALLAGLLFPWVGGTGLVARNSASLLDALPVELTDKTPAGNSRVLAADGSLITNFFTNNRTPVAPDQIAAVMKQALVDIEDSRFYEHNGLDVQGTLRALVTNVAAGSVQEGGSTLTQQLVKQTLLQTAATPEEQQAAKEQTVGRKLKEARLALALEQTYSKDEILTRYLNIVYFGEGAYGIQAAAQKYFSVNAADLTLPQAAMLAGLVQSPTNDDPITQPENAVNRRNQVLQRMHTLKHITDQELADISAQPVAVVAGADPPNGCIDAALGAFFCDYVYSYLTGTLGLSRERHQERRLDHPDDAAAGPAALGGPGRPRPRRRWAQPLVGVLDAVQPGTGHVLAMSINRRYGCYDPDCESVNLNVQGQRGRRVDLQGLHRRGGPLARASARTTR